MLWGFFYALIYSFLFIYLFQITVKHGLKQAVVEPQVRDE